MAIYGYLSLLAISTCSDNFFLLFCDSKRYCGCAIRANPIANHVINATFWPLIFQEHRIPNNFYLPNQFDRMLLLSNSPQQYLVAEALKNNKFYDYMRQAKSSSLIALGKLGFVVAIWCQLPYPKYERPGLWMDCDLLYLVQPISAMGSLAPGL